MTTTSVKNSKTSRIANNMRPVAQLVENRLTASAESRQKETVIKTTHAVTRKLVKLLFSQMSESGIDWVVRLAEEARIATKMELGVDINFALRIRNAELQARRLLPLRVVDPEQHSVVLQLVAKKEGKEEMIASRLVDSWGKLTQALIEGYRISA